MFVVEVTPTWGWIVLAVSAALLLLCLISSFFFDNSFLAVLYFGSLIALLVFLTSPTPVEFSNPHKEPSGISIFSESEANKAEIGKFIEESIGIEKASVRTNGGDNIDFFEDALNGEIFEFTAIDDDSKIDGSFYFTEDTMTIIVEDAEQVKQEFSVSID